MGGHVGLGHEPAPGILGLKYGQGFVWFIMLICTLIIMYSFDWTKMEHFESMRHVSNDFMKTQEKKKVYKNEKLNNQACSSGNKVKAFNLTQQDLRKLSDKKVNYEWAEMMEIVDGKRKVRMAPRISGENFLEHGSKIAIKTMPQIGKHSLMDFPYDDVSFYAYGKHKD